MWQFYVEFLNEQGGVIATKVVTAKRDFQAIEVASRGFTEDYFDAQATRL